MGRDKEAACERCSSSGNLEINCKDCDNCLNPKKQVEAQELLCAVIEAIIAVKENFKADYIIDILQGRETSEVQAHLHEDLEVFGSGMGEEDKTWNAVIRQALIGGYLSKDVENYGLLKVTEEGHKFLKKPKSFKITEDNDFEETEEATLSICLVLSVLIGPLPSIGCPSALTTRPVNASPTGTSTTRPVVLTVSPSLMFLESPSRTAPTLSSSRLSTIPYTSPGNSRSSPCIAFSSP